MYWHKVNPMEFIQVSLIDKSICELPVERGKNVTFHKSYEHFFSLQYRILSFRQHSLHLCTLRVNKMVITVK